MAVRISVEHVRDLVTSRQRFVRRGQNCGAWAAIYLQEHAFSLDLDILRNEGPAREQTNYVFDQLGSAFMAQLLSRERRKNLESAVIA